MEKKLNEQESLNLITEMIAHTRNNFQKGSGNTTIFWGYVTAIFSILNYLLISFSSCKEYSYLIWVLMIPIFLIINFYNKKKSKEALVITHFDKIITNIWIGFFIANIISISSIFIIAIGLKTHIPFLLIIPIIMALVGLGMFITSKVCRFRPYLFGAIVLWVGSILSVILSLQSEQPQMQLLILVVCMVAGYIIPGHMLNKKAEHNV